MNKPAEGTEPSVVQLQETELNAKDSMSNTESASYFGPWMIVEQKVRKPRGGPGPWNRQGGPRTNRDQAPPNLMKGSGSRFSALSINDDSDNVTPVTVNAQFQVGSKSPEAAPRPNEQRKGKAQFISPKAF